MPFSSNKYRFCRCLMMKSLKPIVIRSTKNHYLNKLLPALRDTGSGVDEVFTKHIFMTGFVVNVVSTCQIFISVATILREGC